MSFLLFFVSFVHCQNTCYVSKQGVDNASCGNKTTTACATILQCVDNNPFSNKTLGSAVDIQIFPGTYSGIGFCGLVLKGFVRYFTHY